MSGIQRSRCKISPWCRKNNVIMSIFSYSKSLRHAVPLWKHIKFGHRFGNPAAHLRHPPPAASTAKKIGAARGEFPHWRNIWIGSTKVTKYGMYKLVSMGPWGCSNSCLFELLQKPHLFVCLYQSIATMCQTSSGQLQIEKHIQMTETCQTGVMKCRNGICKVKHETRSALAGTNIQKLNQSMFRTFCIILSRMPCRFFQTHVTAHVYQM